RRDTSGTRRSRARGRPPSTSGGARDLAAPRFGTVEQLAGACQRRRTAARFAAEHRGELHDPALVIELFDLRDSPAVTLALGDPVVDVGVGGDLWQVRDAQDLVASGEGPEAATERIRAPPADARVDLVEHQHGRLVGLRE